MCFCCENIFFVHALIYACCLFLESRVCRDMDYTKLKKIV